MSNLPTTTPNAFLAPRVPSTKSGRISDQIKTDSDYYGPEVYSRLQFYSNFRHETDHLSNDFIPLTQVKANPKLFVVGLLVPSSNLTGRLLDRSARVASVTGNPEEVGFDVEAAPDPTNLTTPSNGSLADRTVNADGTIGSPSSRGANAAALGPEFWDSYVQMCQRLKVSPYALAGPLESESGFNPAADLKINGTSVAKGLNGLIRSTATDPNGVAMSPEVWDNYQNLSGKDQLPYLEKYFKGQVAGKNSLEIYAKNFGSYNNPDGSMYASKARQQAYIAEHPGAVFRNSDYQDLAIKQNQVLTHGKDYITQDDLAQFMSGKPSAPVRTQIDAAIQRVGGQPARVSSAITTESANTSWQAVGSPSAKEAKQVTDKTFDNGLGKAQADLQSRFLAAQSAEINATIRALEVMKNTPPLRLLVNPSSFKVNSEKIISDGNWTRNGPIVEQWGDGQDKLEGSGRVAGFFAIDANSPSDDGVGGPGLTRGARNFSAGYQNFLSLWMLYRNNAGIYTENLDGSTWNRMSMVGSIYIYYDNIMYIGSFDNFNVTEQENSPYTLEYNFQFTVRATFILDDPANPTATFAQGAPAASTVTVTSEQELIRNANQPVAPPPGFPPTMEEFLAQRRQEQTQQESLFQPPPPGALVIDADAAKRDG